MSGRSSTARKSRPISRLLVVAGLVAAGALATAAYFWRPPGETLPIELENALFVHNLPVNRWVRYHAESPGTWSRQAHAGIAFDSRRGSLLVFGSDDHGEDWDNAVHEFHPLKRRWETHYAAADPDTYRTDADGRAVAGAREVMPWAMHTYDNVEYHPRLDALVVTSRPEHNPKVRSVRGVKDHPTWLYELETRRWRPFPNGGKPAPRFFGASSAYDEHRGVLVAYQGGIWEMDLGVGEWRRATAESHHDMHHTMAYDSRQRKLYVFGDYRATNAVWSYRPGAKAGEAGSWELHEAKGDACPPYGAVPVAFDGELGVFVLVVDNPEGGSGAQQRARAASTYIYDPGVNRYTKLPDGNLEPVGMNFMMVWDRNLRVIFLVTGERSGVVTVSAMKLGK